MIANYFKIPDDVAGATLMAAGASSPELFSSLVSLFITHSALGLGTIVGSEIFNQLIICAGAVMCARSGELKLNKEILIREVLFYTLSIILLLVAISDRRPVDSSGTNYIFVSCWKASLLFGGYILYVLVCSFYDSILEKIWVKGEEMPLLRGKSKRVSMQFEEKHIFLKQSYGKEPKENFRGSISDRLDTMHASKRKINNKMIGHFSDRFTNRLFNAATERPSNMHGLCVIEKTEEEFHCFVWQKSMFYNKAKFATHAWNLRWFSFSEKSISSVPDRSNFEHYRIYYPKFESVEVDENLLTIKINTPNAKRKFYYFMAPTLEILDEVTDKLESILSNSNEEALENIDESDHIHEDVESIIEYPHDGSWLDILLFFVLFPFKFLIHWTIPDVRQLSPEGFAIASLNTAFVATFSCLAWLIIGSYFMVASLEALADKMNVPDAIVGATVSAAGTSLPNYVASQVAARQGFGNMAVGNAFGSNVFNLTVGLGLPWVIYILVKGESYHSLRDDGITTSVIILAVVLVLFIILIIASNFVLKQWHAYAFFFMYLCYIIYVICQVIFGGLEN